MNKIFFGCVLLTALASCGRGEAQLEISEEDKEAIRQASLEFHSSMEQAMAEVAETESEVTAYLSPAEPAQKLTGSIDQSNPVKLIEEMLQAIELGHFDSLKPLCDPLGEGDGASKILCNVSDQPAEIQAQYQQHISDNIKFNPDQPIDELGGATPREFYEEALRARKEGWFDVISGETLAVPYTLRKVRRSDGEVYFREDRFKLVERDEPNVFYLYGM